MRRTALLTLLLSLLLPVTLQGQNHQYVVSDSAEYVVDRYLRLLNVDALPADSLLVIETTVTFTGSTDTVTMHRWYMPGQRFRVEVYQKGELQTGLVSNGKDRFSRYNRRGQTWEKIHVEELEDAFRAYDFRGPLYDWRGRNAELTWEGIATVNNHALQSVKVSCPDFYDRHYMFEPESGLLVLIVETEFMPGVSEKAPLNENHIDWKTIHEYQPLGASLLVTQESFARNGMLTVLTSTVHFEPADEALFNRD